MLLDKRLFALLVATSTLYATAAFAVDIPPAPAAKTAESPAIETPAAPTADTRPSKKASDDLIYRTNVGRADDVKILLTGDASANDTNELGVPLISLAASRTDPEGVNVMKTLLDNGADINKQDTRGQSPLFYAARSGNRDAVDFLLKKGINYAAADRNGNTARNVAFQSDHNNIVEVMDQFVSGKNDATHKEYDEANRQLSERYKTYNEAIERDNARLAAAGQTATSPGQNAIALQRMRQYVHDISFSSCALEYWAFCAQNQQPTELGNQKLAQNIRAQRDKAVAAGREFMQSFGVSKEVVSKIVVSSAGQIDTQLTAMQTVIARREQNVGTIDDMNARCNAVANTWNKTEAKQ